MNFIDYVNNLAKTDMQLRKLQQDASRNDSRTLQKQMMMLKDELANMKRGAPPSPMFKATSKDYYDYLIHLSKKDAELKRLYETEMKSDPKTYQKEIMRYKYEMDRMKGGGGKPSGPGGHGHGGPGVPPHKPRPTVGGAAPRPNPNGPRPTPSPTPRAGGPKMMSSDSFKAQQIQQQSLNAQRMSARVNPFAQAQQNKTMTTDQFNMKEAQKQMESMRSVEERATGMGASGSISINDARDYKDAQAQNEQKFEYGLPPTPPPRPKKEPVYDDYSGNGYENEEFFDDPVDNSYQSSQPSVDQGQLDELKRQLDEQRRITEEQVRRAEDTQAIAKDWEKKYYEAFTSMQNTREVLKKEVADEKKMALQGIIKELIPVMDSFDIVFAQEVKDEAVLAYIEGFKITYNKLANILKSKNVEILSPALGDEYDPTFMEAIQVAPSTIQNKVMAIHGKAYVLNGVLIRPARVIISVLNQQA